MDSSSQQVRKESVCLIQATPGSSIRDETKGGGGRRRLPFLWDNVASLIVGLQLYGTR